MTITNKVLKVTKIRNTEYYDMTYVFDDLYAKSLKNQKFTNLLEIIDFYNMHCHHKIPRKRGGTDEYNNLVIVEREVHTLIHAVDEEVIAKLLGKLSLDKKKLAKLNTLRTKSGNKAINW